jgi:hypothetical protein
MHQMLAASEGSELFKSGVELYFDPSWLWLVPVGFFLALARWAAERSLSPFRDQLGGIIAAAFCGLLVWILFRTGFGVEHWAMGRAVWLLCIGVLVGRVALLVTGNATVEEWRSMLLLAGVGFVAWCASISWGYVSPLLGLAAMGAAVDAALASFRLPRVNVGDVAVWLTTVFVAIVVWRLNYTFPYGDWPHRQLTADLSHLFPRFGHIYTNAETYARIEELRDLVQTHARDTERPYIVVSDYPLIHYWFGDTPAGPMSWYFDWEMKRFADRVREDVRAFDGVIMLQKERMTPIGGPPPTGAPVAPTWIGDIYKVRPVEHEGTYFIVLGPVGSTRVPTTTTTAHQESP